MKYMLLIYGNDDLWTSFDPDEMGKLVGDTNAWIQDLIASGEHVGSYGVADQVQAKTVRLTDGAPVVTDGPYIEAKEYIGSFTIVDCESEARALEIAAANPAARSLEIEVRPIEHEAAPEV